MSLSQYTNGPQTELFEKYGAFFAFTDSAFNEKSVNGVQYVSLGAGLYAPRANALAITKGMDEIFSSAIALHKADKSQEEIILEALNNFECFYTWDLSDAFELLECYGYSTDEIEKVFAKHASS